MYVETFGDRLKDLMDSEGYNNSTLSYILNINRKTVGRWLNGKNLPNYMDLIKISRCFHVSVDYLLGEIKQLNVQISEKPDLAFVRERFVEKIFEYMRKKNLTEHAFSEKLGLHHKSVTRWLDRGGMPEADTLVKISRVTGFTIDHLLGIE